LEFFLDDGNQNIGGDGAPNLLLTAFLAERLRQNSTVVGSVNCLELPADGHFAWDVRWQGLKPNLLPFVYGPTKVVP
jgi:hypothetical protein